MCGPTVGRRRGRRNLRQPSAPVLLGRAVERRDPILKERLFGLSGNQGNHGEDVKECYYYLDSTPTHTYMKCLYKYPQAEFPYARLGRRKSEANA